MAGDSSGLFEIDDRDFGEIQRLVRSTVGITLNDQKRELVVARLGKRLRHYGYRTFREYCRHLRERDPQGKEVGELINCITTNKTEFFRESHHFDWMRRVLLPELGARAKASGTRRLRIWSAGCSTGQEPYTLAMVLAEELGAQSWDMRILASDIDTEVLAHAEAGEYTADAMAGVPEPLRSRYFERKGSRLVASRRLKELVTFRRVNLVDSAWPIRVRFDAIFCRNVTIYFDRETQERLYDRFIKQLEPHGYLFAGHSENLHWLGKILAQVGPTVYRPVGRTVRTSRRAPPAHAPSRRPPAASRRPPSPSRRPTRPPAMMPPSAIDVAIQSGGLHVGVQPTLIRTVLGSCVAACVFDSDKRIGGMNHFMLPDGVVTDGIPTRFGTHAMNALLDELVSLGARREALRAKVFGGVHVLRGAAASANIPEDNVAFVRRFLAERGIPIDAERVGGRQAMTVWFETHTGRVFVRTLDGADAKEVAQSESRYRKALNVLARQSQREMRSAKETA